MKKYKKNLGQHLLIDTEVAQKMASLLHGTTGPLVEIGPGKGALTKFLLPIHDTTLWAVEIDREFSGFLKMRFPQLKNRIIEQDILKLNWHIFGNPITVVGNFPYSISSQIFFKILTHHNQVNTTVCMLQKEVALRIASKKGSKTYGILSVLLQAYYNIEFLFEVSACCFFPRPKVTSAIIRLQRNHKQLKCNEEQFRKVVKQGFQNRRKTLRNALKKLNLAPSPLTQKLLAKRAEQLSVDEFSFLTRQLEKQDDESRKI